MYNDIAYLCSETVTQDEYFNEVKEYTERQVFVQPKSVGMREFYAAATADLHPSLVLVLADYYDYDGEKVMKYNDKYYDVTRTYVNKNRLEITLTERLARYGEDD